MRNKIDTISDCALMQTHKTKPSPLHSNSTSYKTNEAIFKIFFATVLIQFVCVNLILALQNLRINCASTRNIDRAMMNYYNKSYSINSLNDCLCLKCKCERRVMEISRLIYAIRFCDLIRSTNN